MSQIQVKNTKNKLTHDAYKEYKNTNPKRYRNKAKKKTILHGLYKIYTSQKR